MCNSACIRRNSQITALCIDAQNRNSCAELFCTCLQNHQNEKTSKFHVYTQKLHITAMCLDAQISPLWSFPKFGRTQNRSTHRAEFLRMNANVNFLEFLRICADFSSVMFVWTYAKSLHAEGRVSCVCTQLKTSGVSADLCRLLLCGISATVRIRYLRIYVNQ